MKFIKSYLDSHSNFKLFLIFMVGFLFSFLYFGIILSSFCDDIWSYGFSYNISKGMVIYRDFNVLQMPLFFMIGSVFIRIFGNYMISINILTSIFLGILFLLLYKMFGYKNLFLILIFGMFRLSGYNLFCTFLVFLILYLIYVDRYNDIIIALLVSFLFLTKQNIGIVMLIPMLYYSKNKLKSFCLFMIPVMCLIIYLVYNEAFFSFVDYAFLGLFDFQKNNAFINWKWFVVEFFVCLFLIFRLVKSGFSDKMAFYTLAFQFLAFPLLEESHLSGALFCFFVYFVSCNFHLNKIIILIFHFSFSFCFILFSFILIFNISINMNHDFMYLKNDSEFVYRLQYLREYLENNGYDLDNGSYYFTEVYGYAFKLYYDIPINRYDFMITGNMGLYNKPKIYKEVLDNCSKNRCIFFVDDSYIRPANQWNETANFIMNNYDFVEKIYTIEVYSNDNYLKQG